MTLRDYDIIDEIGSGGFGTVYSARHRVLRRVDALKVMDRVAATDSGQRRLFERECAAMAKVDHPNLTRVYDAGISKSGKPWLAMELLHGGCAADHSPMDWQAATRLLAQACAGVQALHDAGVIHRDLKAENLMLTSDGTLKVSDLGIAVLGEDFSTTLRLGGHDIAGTIPFMAPELLAGEEPTVASDVYALGATFHQLVDGRPPFVDDSPTVAALMSRILNGPVPPTGPEIPEHLSGTIRACMASDPSERPSSAAELGRALESAGGQDRDPGQGAGGFTNGQLFELPPAAPGRSAAEARLRRLAAGGDQNAMYRLAGRLRERGAVPESRIWTARAASAGHPGAMYQLGLQYRDEGREAEARQWFVKASDAGHLMAHAEL